MIFKRGDVYWYEFVFAGKRYRASTKVRSGRGVPGQQSPKERAKQIETSKRMNLALSAGGIKQIAPAPMFESFTERFLKWVDAEKVSKPKTAQFYHDMVRLLLKFEPFKHAKLDEINEESITRYIELRRSAKRAKVTRQKAGKVKITSTSRPIKTASINRELATLRRMLRVAFEWKLIAAFPVIHMLPGEGQSERVLTQQEEEAYLEKAPPLLKDFAIIALDTGMRPEEITRIRWENVRFEPVGDAKYGYLHNPYGKTARAKRNVPITARVHQLIQERHEQAGKPKVGFLFPRDKEGKEHVSYDSIKSRHDATMRSLTTLATFRLYDLRHTLLTRLGESNADAFAIQKIAGHSTITVSQRYVHPTPERVEDAFSRLEIYNARKVEELKSKREAEEEKSRAAVLV